MAKRILHCDLCSQGKPRLCVDEIIITIDERDYPVRVCDRHRAVMKNMFLGVIPVSAFGDETPKVPVKRAIASAEGKIAPTQRKAPVKRTATKPVAVKKAARKALVTATPAEKTAKRAVAVKKAAPTRKSAVKRTTTKKATYKSVAATPVKRGPGRPRKTPAA